MNLIQKEIAILSELQKEAVNWSEGPMLMLAGPGAGKTKVLTTRLAKILHDSTNQKYRILALTFITKATDEMRQRVERLVPNVTNRMFIGTFHSFGAKILRQHGYHIGIKPDFVIYDNINDRNEILKEALRSTECWDSHNYQYSARWLRTIDLLRMKQISYEDTPNQFSDASFGNLISMVYEVYEKALHDNNALDFNGLILNANKLLNSVSVLAASYRNVFRLWFIDEFQDTTIAQYEFVKILAGNEFKNIFVVADDDQIIFQWAGASISQLENFRAEFHPSVLQLVENRRCPSSVVRLANSLIQQNTNRITSKKDLVSLVPNGTRSVVCRDFHDDSQEAVKVSEEIQKLKRRTNETVAVLGRTKAILEATLAQLKNRNVKSSMAIRRDSFVSPHYNWLTNCLELANQPSNPEVLRKLTVYGNLVSGTNLDPEIIIAEPISTCISYLEHWAGVMEKSENSKAIELAFLAKELVHSRVSWKKMVEKSVGILKRFANTSNGPTDDITEDWQAWDSITKNILRTSKGNLELKEFVHELNIRSKEPPTDPSEVQLFTIHSAKGLEFDHVWLIGMVDDVLPSWHSLKEGAEPRLLEEERRSCFVAITRTMKTLNISYAKCYNGYRKDPSRFLYEMGLLDSRS